MPHPVNFANEIVPCSNFISGHLFYEQEPAKVCSYGKNRDPEVDDDADLKNFCGLDTSPYPNDNSYILAEIDDEFDACRFRAELKLKESSGFVEMAYLKFRFGNKTALDDYTEVFTVGSCGPISKYGTEEVGTPRY